MNEIPIRNKNDMTGPTYTNDSSLTSTLEAKNDNLYKRLKQLYPCVEDVTKLPQCWSTEARSQPLGLTWDHLGCYFRTSVVRREDDDKNAASVITDNYVLRSCLIYYYEIKQVGNGREGSIGLGMACIKSLNESIPLNKLPGWTRQSYGYHGDDGQIFNAGGPGHAYGPTFTTGDVIGCGLNLVEGKCFFTRNGINLGTAFKDLPTQSYFYPILGLRTARDEILANFGQESFVYDIEQDLRSLRKNMTFAISNHPITNFTDWQSTLHKLVQSWLIQNSYSNTAEAFSKSTKLEFKENRNRLRQRQRIQELILEGKISEAISLIPRLSPNLLQEKPNLLFALRCRQFIELIGGAEKDYQPLDSISDLTDRLTPDTTNGSDSKMIMQQNSTDSVISMDDTTTMNGGDSSNHIANGSTGSNYVGHAGDNNGDSFDEDVKLKRLLQFGQDLTNHLLKLDRLYGKDENNEKMLQDAIGLIAFSNPHQSYASNLLDPQERQKISQQLNNYIAESEAGDSHRLPMDEVMNHLKRIIKLNDSYGRWLLDKLC